jgi:hypothetical protein
MKSMKNIFKIKSLLLYITAMTLFSLDNVSADDLNSSMSTNSSERNRNKKRKAQKRQGKKRKSENNTRKSLRSKKTRKKTKSKYPSSEVVVSTISESEIEKALDKTQMPFNAQAVYESGMKILEEVKGDEKSENTIQVGSYYLEIPEGVSAEEVQLLMDNLNHIVPLVMTGAINEQFNLNAVAAILNKESDYSEIKSSNEEKVREAIKNTDMYKLMEKPEIKKLIQKIISLELKTMINPEFRENKKSLWGRIKSKFRKNTITENIKYFINNNSILNEVQFLQDINLKQDANLGLSPKELYLIASTAYYMENHKESIFDSRLFDSLIHGITIPLKAKVMKMDEFELLNQSKHKEMRTLYKKMLNLYGVKVSGIVESSSGKLILESTAYYYFMKFLKYGAAGIGVASTGVLARGAYHAYNGDEKLSALDRAKAGINKDIDDVKEFGSKTTKELSEWGSEKGRQIGEVKDQLMDTAERAVGYNGRFAERSEAAALEAKEKSEKELAAKNSRRKYLASNADFGLDGYDFGF